MIEEPYRWVEAIANRREYIEAQLASGSPIAALGYRDGILFLTLGRTRQKIFEIYDRIAMGAIGHPGRHRAIANGRYRTGQHGRLHPVGGRCFIATARALFAQSGNEGRVRTSLWPALPGTNALRGDRRTTGGGFVCAGGIRWRNRDQRRNLCASAAGLRRTQRDTAIQRTNGSISGNSACAGCRFQTAFNSALDAWSIGHMTLQTSDVKEQPERTAVRKYRAGTARQYWNRSCIT